MIVLDQEAETRDPGSCCDVGELGRRRNSLEEQSLARQRLDQHTATEAVWSRVRRTSPDPGTRVSSPVPACIIITDQQPLACKHLLMLTRHGPDLDKEDFMVTTSNTGFHLLLSKIMRLILMLAWDYFWREFVEEVARVLPGATQNIFLLIIL